MDPNPQTTDTIDSEEEELFRQMEEETEKEIELQKKVSQLQPIQVCPQDCHLEPEAHNTSHSIRKFIEKARENENSGQSVDYRTGKFVKPDEYTDGFMQVLELKGTCPYMPVKLLENNFDALMDSGSGLSLISRSAATKLMKKAQYRKSYKKKEKQHTKQIRLSTLSTVTGSPYI